MCTIEERIGLGRLIELTGNRALPGFTAPKLLWLRRHEPEVYDRIAHVLLPKDYVRLKRCRRAGHRRCGRVRRCFSMSPTGLERRCPHRAGDPSRLAAAVRESTEVAGAGDQAAGANGRRRALARPASVVWDLRRRLCGARAFSADPEGRAHVFCHAAPETWLRWRDALGGRVDELVRGPSPRRQLQATWTEGRGPGSRRRRPALCSVSERRAHAARRPECTRAFVGLASPRPGRVGQAVLEGVAYGLRDSLELLRGLGCEVTAGRVSGGGARSRLWLEIVASVLGLPLQRTAVEEGAAYGAALLGGVASGAFRDVREAVAECVKVRDEIDPNPKWSARTRRLRAVPHALPALRPLEEQ